MKQWIKLSAGVHKDRKLWKLSKDAQLVFFYLLSIAGSEDRNGFLPSAEDIALELWFLKLKPKELSAALLSLAEAGIIEESQTDEIKLTNFEKWQTAEKTKSEIDREYYLKNKKLKSESQRNLSENSAEIKRNLSEQSEKISEKSAKIPTLEIDKEIDIEKDKDINSFSNEKEYTRAKNSPRRKFGSAGNVLLTDDEYRKLHERFIDADERIENLSLGIASKGYKYKDHYATILNWARRDAEKQTAQPQKQPETTFGDIRNYFEAAETPQWDIDL